jgi:hypothetical protein
MRPGKATLYTIASDNADEFGLMFNASQPETIASTRCRAWKAYLSRFGEDDTKENRRFWMRRGFRVVRVSVTVKDARVSRPAADRLPNGKAD